MLGVITGVGALIHAYASGYMREDARYRQFFAYMNLFVAMMILLVLGDNLLLLYLGWEGVGLCSYLLIGFWNEDPANGAAARKAFITTRVGDTAMAVTTDAVQVLGLGQVDDHLGPRRHRLDLVVGDLRVLLAGRHFLALLVFALLLGDLVLALGLGQPHLLVGLGAGLVLRVQFGLGDLLLGLGLGLADVLGVVLH